MTWAAHVGMLSGFKHISFVYPGLSLRSQPWDQDFK